MLAAGHDFKEMPVPPAIVPTGRQQIVFGIPCLIAPQRRVCRYRPVPAPAW